jgi:hypothetical protein
VAHGAVKQVGTLEALTLGGWDGRTRSPPLLDHAVFKSFCKHRLYGMLQMTRSVPLSETQRTLVVVTGLGWARDYVLERQSQKMSKKHEEEVVLMTEGGRTC